MNAVKISSARKEKWQRYTETLKYAKHVMFHPFDGFWDLTHEAADRWQRRTRSLPCSCLRGYSN